MVPVAASRRRPPRAPLPTAAKPVLQRHAYGGHVLWHRVRLSGKPKRVGCANGDSAERGAAPEIGEHLRPVDIARHLREADPKAWAEPGDSTARIEREPSADVARGNGSLGAEHVRIERVAGWTRSIAGRASVARLERALRTGDGATHLSNGSVCADRESHPPRA